VTEYLRRSGLLPDLEALGFHVVGYGCTTCIGNSGPLPPGVEGRSPTGSWWPRPCSPATATSRAASTRTSRPTTWPRRRSSWPTPSPAPPTSTLRPSRSGRTDGAPVTLSDIWPSQKEVAELEAAIGAEMFRRDLRQRLRRQPRLERDPGGRRRPLRLPPESTYIQEPPFFEGLTRQPAPLTDIVGARVLAVLGDSVTTDHISPAGRHRARVARRPLPRVEGGREEGLQLLRLAARQRPRDGARHVRQHPPQERHGAGVEGGVTVHVPSGERMDIYDAAERYRAEGRPSSSSPARSTAAAPRATGRPRDAPPRRARGHRGELRADPPVEPRRHGRPAPAVQGRARTPSRWASPATSR
jgi:aconitate hydratase